MTRRIDSIMAQFEKESKKRKKNPNLELSKIRKEIEKTKLKPTLYTEEEMKKFMENYNRTYSVRTAALEQIDWLAKSVTDSVVQDLRPRIGTDFNTEHQLRSIVGFQVRMILNKQYQKKKKLSGIAETNPELLGKNVRNAMGYA